MKKLSRQYNAHELAKIIKIMEAGFEEARPHTSVVLALHRCGYKIIELNKDNCIDYEKKDV